MRKNDTKQKIYACLLALALTAGLCGCGNKREKVEYGGAGIQSETDGQSQGNPSGTLYEKLGVEDLWQERIGDEYATTIYTHPQVPDVSEMKVVSAKEKYFDAEAKKELLTILAEDTIYKYGEGDIPKSDIEREIIDYEDRIAYMEGSLSGSPEDDEFMSWWYEQLDELHRVYDAAPENLQPIEDYSGDSYLIKMNNMEFVVEFTADEEANDSSVSIRPRDGREMSKESDEYTHVEPGYFVNNGETEGENLCSITEEEAKRTALDFVKKMNVGDFTVVDSYPLYLMGEKNDSDYLFTWYDGYTVILHRELDGVRVEGDMYEYSVNLNLQLAEVSGDYTNMSMGYQYGYEKIIVCVNDKGIVQMRYFSPYRMEGVETGNVTLLTYEKVIDIFRTEIEEDAQKTAWPYYGGATFSYLELMYFPLRSGENEDDYTIIPVWRLTNGYSYQDITNYIVINAIDGSIINVGEQSLTQEYDDYDYSE